jgi:hypothetical protein
MIDLTIHGHDNLNVTVEPLPRHRLSDPSDRDRFMAMMEKDAENIREALRHALPNSTYYRLCQLLNKDL